MEKLIKVLKDNKRTILNGALLVGGSILGAVLANRAGQPCNDEQEVEYYDVQPEDISTEETVEE